MPVHFSMAFTVTVGILSACHSVNVEASFPANTGRIQSFLSLYLCHFKFSRQGQGNSESNARALALVSLNEYHLCVCVILMRATRLGLSFIFDRVIGKCLANVFDSSLCEECLYCHRSGRCYSWRRLRLITHDLEVCNCAGDVKIVYVNHFTVSTDVVFCEFYVTLFNVSFALQSHWSELKEGKYRHVKVSCTTDLPLCDR